MTRLVYDNQDTQSLAPKTTDYAQLLYLATTFSGLLSFPMSVLLNHPRHHSADSSSSFSRHCSVYLSRLPSFVPLLFLASAISAGHSEASTLVLLRWSAMAMSPRYKKSRDGVCQRYLDVNYDDGPVSSGHCVRNLDIVTDESQESRCVIKCEALVGVVWTKACRRS